MANYSDALWPTVQLVVDDLMQRPEFKHKPSAAIMTLLKNTDFLLTPEERQRVDDVKRSDSQGVEVNIINKQATTTITNRAYNHSGSKNDSTKETLTFVTRGAKFAYSLKEADRNIWTLAEIIAKQLISAAIDTHGVIETYLMSWMNTNKSQVVESATPVSGDWDGTNYIFGVTAGDSSRFFQKIKGFMREQFYSGMFDVVANEAIIQEAEYLIQQGQGNNTNLAWQLSELNLANSQELTNDAGYNGMAYMMPSQTVGLVPWIPALNKQGHGNPFANGGGYRSIPDPLGSGLTFAVHELAAGADNQSTSGERQDVDIDVEISVDFAPVAAPMSTSNASPIFKVGQKS